MTRESGTTGAKRRGAAAERRRDRRGAGFWVILALLLIPGCHRGPPPPHAVARIDGEQLTHAEFERFLQRNAVDDVPALEGAVLSTLLDQFVDERLLLRLGRDQLGLGEHVQPREAVSSLLASSSTEPRDEQVLDWYRANREAYRRPERVRLHQVLVTDRATAERLREDWATGANFSEVRRRWEASPAVHIGQEGEFSRTDLPPGVADVVFALAEGAVSEVLSADYGFHVLQVVRRFPAGVAELPEVESALRAELREQARAQALARLVEQARERYNVRVFERNLPFDYGGTYSSSKADGTG